MLIGAADAFKCYTGAEHNGTAVPGHSLRVLNCPVNKCTNVKYTISTYATDITMNLGMCGQDCNLICAVMRMYMNGMNQCKVNNFISASFPISIFFQPRF